jgi:hypothetical protein
MQREHCVRLTALVVDSYQKLDAKTGCTPTAPIHRSRFSSLHSFQCELSKKQNLPYPVLPSIPLHCRFLQSLQSKWKILSPSVREISDPHLLSIVDLIHDIEICQDVVGEPIGWCVCVVGMCEGVEILVVGEGRVHTGSHACF